MNDDFNSPIAIAQLFEGAKLINSIAAGKKQINESNLEKFKQVFKAFYFDILGLEIEGKTESENEVTDELMDLIIQFRQAAKAERDYATADKIRDKLKELNIVIKDQKDGASWEYEN
jgi:cysteinyl-tRNA synthetase